LFISDPFLTHFQLRLPRALFYVGNIYSFSFYKYIVNSSWS